MNYFLIDKALSVINYKMYILNYNMMHGNTEKLKKHHEQYFLQLLKQANGQLYERNKRGESITKAILFTNSEHLGKVLGCSSRTIRNYNTRLCEAGIIKKIYHGQVRDYEIIFNEFLVPLKDLNNKNGNWIPYLNNSEATGFAKYINNISMRKNLPSLKELLEQYNNQLIEKESVNNQIKAEITLESLHEKYSKIYIHSIEDYLRLISDFGYSNAKIDEAIDEATGNKGMAEPFESVEKKEVPPADRLDIETPHQKILKKIKSEHMLKVLKTSNINELKYVFAYLLFSYSLEKIPGWKDNIYPQVVENTVVYIAENYFEEYKSKQELEKALVKYQKTIKISALIIRKKLYSGSWKRYWVFPETFFPTEYKNGFKGADRLLDEKQTQKRKSNLNRQRVELNEKLNKILLEYFQKPDKNNYGRLLTKVRDTMPSRESQFIYCIKNDIRKIENYYCKQHRLWEI